MGAIFNKIFYSWLLFNIGVMVVVTGKALKLSAKRCYNQRYQPRKPKKK